MTRPLLLDLFCGEGGASMGYHQAGFEVVGVDIEPQPLYPFEFVRADAMQVLDDEAFIGRFSAVHASPPCTGHTTIASLAGVRGRHGTEWILHETVDRLTALGLPYVVENVAGADLPGALILCGSEFGLTDGPYLLRRHRRFASNVFLMGAGGCNCSDRRVIGVYGDLSRNDRRATSRTSPDGRPYRDMRAGIERARRILRMPWASAAGLTQAIPPAYTEWIGEQLLDAMRPIPGTAAGGSA